MTKEQVLKLLEENKNDKGIIHWSKTGSKKLISFGMGVTQIKDIAKKIGKNHDLAIELWELPIYETKVLATIIDEPELVTRQQVKKQTKELDFWLLSHSYCSNLLSKVDYLKEQMEEWIEHSNAGLRRCGFLLLYNYAKDNRNAEDEYFVKYISRIEKEIQTEENFVKDAMNTALFMMGQRSRKLNKKAIETAKRIGKVEVDYGDNSCQALNVLKHLTSERVQKKLA